MSAETGRNAVKDIGAGRLPAAVIDTFAALTDNSGGTAADTIAAIGATYDQAEVRNAVASLAAKVNEIHAALVDAGMIAAS